MTLLHQGVIIPTWWQGGPAMMIGESEPTNTNKLTAE